MIRGYFGIGIEHSKDAFNVGTLWRSAQILNASFIFTIGKRYDKQVTDVLKSWRHVPLFHYADFATFFEALPQESLLVGIELDEKAEDISTFKHPERATYLLGAEDHGLTKEALAKVHRLIKLPGDLSLNVATAGSIVMFDRHQKRAACCAATRSRRQAG